MYNGLQCLLGMWKQSVCIRKIY